MTLTLPELKGLTVGEYGKAQVVTLKDFDGAAQDVSTYTGITVVCRSPEGTKTLAIAGSFLTDGSDGKVAWSFSTGALLDRDGVWDFQVELTKTGYATKSYPFSADVQKALR
jgi:hypothetical protein